MTVLLFGILLAASTSAASDDAVRLQAAQCGLKPDQLVWTVDAQGRRHAELIPNGGVDKLSFKSMKCLLDWAAKSRVRIGFASQPASATKEAEEAAKAVSECGLGTVTARYDSEIEEDVLNANNADSATDAQLACADKVVGSLYILELPSNVQTRFDAIQEARSAPVVRAQARAWLAARGFLDRIPAYKPGVTDDAAFTRQVEGLCGPHARGAFQSKFGFHVLSPDWVKRNVNPSKEGAEVFGCLTNVTMAAGFNVALIGNEYYRSR